MLAILLIVQFPANINQWIGWAALYLVDVKAFVSNTVNYPLTTYWSLSHEEQFYLILPLLIFLTPKSKQLWLIIALILASIMFRTFMYVKTGEYIKYSYSVLASFDLFGLGVLLAWMRRRFPAFKISGWWVLGCYALFLVFNSGSPLDPYVHFKGRSLISIALPIFGVTSFCLIAAALSNSLGVFSKLLDSQPLQYVGRISYGVYVYHSFLPFVLRYFLPAAWGVPHLTTEIISAVLTIGVASLSFYFFEKPINNLKARFEYA
jgi:peptidoglycan/LPS O-acetylase OafA/YrhL